MYSPKEDSFLLSETIKKFFKGKRLNSKKFLDMGSGSGIQAETLLNFAEKKNIVCADIDPEVIRFLLKKGFNAVQSDLFENIKETFDFIVFNPPYLPEDKYDKEKDTTGGKKGDETILRFLKQSLSQLNKDGKIFLLLSSLTPGRKIFDFLTNNFKSYEKLAEEKIFFESLEVWVITK
jgi:release factor glutamine methyltransferase